MSLSNPLPSQENAESTILDLGFLDRGSLFELAFLELADEGGEVGIFVHNLIDLILELSGGTLQRADIDPQAEPLGKSKAQGQSSPRVLRDGEIMGQGCPKAHIGHPRPAAHIA